MSHIEIIPAILPKSFGEIEEKISFVKSASKVVQIDICDGRFVSNVTWPYNFKDEHYSKLMSEDEGLPGWDSLDFEFDLMINNPELEVDKWIQIGASTLIFHTESSGNFKGIINKISQKVDIGVAFNPDTPIDEIGRYREEINFVQLMGISNIGHQHEIFIQSVIGKVKEVRLKYPGLPISVDGGVTLDNAIHLINAGADRLVIGSAIFDSPNPVDALEKFKHLA